MQGPALAKHHSIDASFKFSMWGPSMWHLSRKLIALAIATLVVAVPASADQVAQSRGQDRQAIYMRVFGVTNPPYAFVEFCERDPAECSQGPGEETRIAGNAEQMVQLDRINRSVNAEIQPATDMELYGVTDYWTIPQNGKGDCEDYALLKRQRLMQMGWPASALLMTVVYDEKNEGHAILTARTANGDFILDNKTDELKLWSKTPYRYVMRQSYLNPRIWMSLDPKEAATSVPLASARTP